MGSRGALCSGLSFSFFGGVGDGDFEGVEDDALHVTVSGPVVGVGVATLHATAVGSDVFLLFVGEFWRWLSGGRVFFLDFRFLLCLGCFGG